MHEEKKFMSFRLISSEFSNRKLVLSNSINNNNNIFTLITGKNGLGKTRLLNFIIYHFIKDTFKKNSYYYRVNNADDFDLYEKINNYSLEYTQIPARIIVHTNSKFDKFPDQYASGSRTYINISNSSRSRYSESSDIFEKILFSKNFNSESIKDTLSYLNYSSLIQFRTSIISSGYTGGYLNKMTKEYESLLKELNFDLDKPPQKFKKYQKKLLSVLYHFDEHQIKPPTPDEIKNLYYLITEKKILDYYIDVTVNLENNKYDYGHLHKNDFLLLTKYNLVRVSNIFLNIEPHNSNHLFSTEKSKNNVSFFNLSSGQKSIINTLLGISSVIENNSLVCIDEPEISLHPEWQDEIIQKLQEVFHETKGCHFLIATHSPHVVSGLNSENGFILDLENNITHNSLEYSKKSADFQLAKIFNSPGYNNEYIIKICLFLLSKIKDQRTFDESDIKSLKELKSFQSSMKLDDPVYYLVKEVISLSEV